MSSMYILCMTLHVLYVCMYICTCAYAYNIEVISLEHSCAYAYNIEVISLEHSVFR